MQQNHADKHEDKLDQTKEQFFDVHEVRKMDEDVDSSFDVEASTTKSLSEPKTIEEANSTHDKSIPSKKLPESQADLKSSMKNEISNGGRKMDKGANSNVGEALPAKKPSETITESLKREANKEYEVLLLEKQASLDQMKKEMDDARLFEQDAMYLLSECKRRIYELEDELEKSRASEQSLYDALVIKKKQLNLNKILFEESKSEIATLKESVMKFQESQSSVSMKEMVEAKEVQVESEKLLKDPGETKNLIQQMSLLRNELELATDGEERDSVAKNLLEELTFLKNELKLAMQAEENSKTAMDDLVLALNEVATEARQTKEKLDESQAELKQSKEETEHLKALLNRTEENYKHILGEARKEAETSKNTSERLRLEAEESLLAWNEKTKEFVNCLKISDDERAISREECKRLQEKLKETENKIRVSKDENQKLRDILKQALNEANAAKEAAGIAQSENAQLKDVIGEKEEALKKLSHENEMLKIHESAAFENIKELKRLLAEAPIRELKNNEEKEKSSTKETGKGKAHKEEHKEPKNLGKAISFNLKDILPYNRQPQQHKEGSSEEPAKEVDDDDLKGSIFEEANGDVVIPVPENYDYDHDLNEVQLDDQENNSRKRSALFRKFGNLIVRRKTPSHKKEPSITDDRFNLISPRPN